jgi:hypothetical protein
MSYWGQQLDRIQMSGGQVKIKIRNSEASTNWLSLTSEEYLEVENLLRRLEKKEEA